MRNLGQKIIFISLVVVLSGCFARMDVFDVTPDEADVPHIGNFYSTLIYDEPIADEIWVSPEPACISMDSQSEHKYSGNSALHVVWDKGAGSCDWIGIGFGWNAWTGKNFGSIYDHSAIRLRVRTDGKPIKNIPMAMALECYDGGSAWVGFNRKMIQGDEIGKEWTDVIIPILAFNWAEMNADVSNVKQFMMEFQASGDIYLDNIEVIEYEGSFKSRGNIVSTDNWNNTELQSSLLIAEGKPFSLDGNDVFLRMDNTHLYVNATILDDTPLQNSKEGDKIWDGDAIEIAISTNDEAPVGRNFFMSTDKHIGIKACAEPSVWDWRKKRGLDACEVNINKNDSGYTLSAKIPLEELDIDDDFKDRAIHGLEIAIDQGDSESRKRQIRWNSADVEGFHKNPSLWGEARIIKY